MGSTSPGPSLRSFNLKSEKDLILDVIDLGSFSQERISLFWTSRDLVSDIHEVNLLNFIYLSISILVLYADLFYNFLNTKKRNMDYKKWECIVCGLIYDEAEGWPEDGIEPGTKWEDVPEDWICPECGVGKEDFDMVEFS